MRLRNPSGKTAPRSRTPAPVRNTACAGGTIHSADPVVDLRQRTDEQPQKTPSVPHVGSASARRILVLDDHESLVDLLSAVLRRAGYNVVEALSPLEAIDICENCGKTIDLILADFNMPGLNGTQFAEWARVILPDARFIFMTGDVNACYGLIAKGLACLQKPFTFAELVWRIEEALKPEDQWRNAG